VGASGPVERFARSLTYPTVSARIDEPATREAFSSFLDFLHASYPALFAAASVDRRDPWRLVLELPGTDASLDPALLLAHYDVVDVAPGSRETWSHDPFSGDVAGGYVRGRGALDDKNALVAILEAADSIVASGTMPRRGLVLAFGGDEELSGRRGAAAIAAGFAAAGRRFHMVLDEGAIVADRMLPAQRRPIALVGVAEKGHVNVAIRSRTGGGHAAMPPRRTAVGELARAITRIERRPFPARLIPTIRDFFRAQRAEVPFPVALVYRFPRLFWPALRAALTASPNSAALVRTTQAVTVARGGDAPNVLPASAEAIVNVRTLPGDTVETVLRRYRSLLRGRGVDVEVADPDAAHEPVTASGSGGAGYRAVAEVAARVFDCVPAPYLVTGSTDSKWYASLAGEVLRFVPMVLTAEEVERIHGVDERLSVDNFLRMVRFYDLFIREVCL